MWPRLKNSPHTYAHEGLESIFLFEFIELQWVQTDFLRLSDNNKTLYKNTRRHPSRTFIPAVSILCCGDKDSRTLTGRGDEEGASGIQRAHMPSQHTGTRLRAQIDRQDLLPLIDSRTGAALLESLP